MTSETTLIFALIGGILPALLWLWFWLREDVMSPEPRKLLMLTFFAGMASTLIALTLENASKPYLPNVLNALPNLSLYAPIVIWAFIEEASKFGAAYFTALKRRENDEPVDNMIYLITAALGFAALETAFYLVNPIQNDGVINSIITGNMRFIGTAPLHIVCSATIGIFMAFAFCKLPRAKNIYAGMGLITATILHSLFNFFIIKDDANLLVVFAVVWVGVIVLLLFFERVKRINQSCVY